VNHSPDTPLAQQDEPPAPDAGFAEFYRDATPGLVGFLMWQGASLDVAADCVQDTMTLCYRSWSDIRTPEPWCRTVASRQFARRFAEVERPVEDVEKVVRTPLLRPECDFEEFDRRHWILAEIRKLPPRQRQVMAWTYAGADAKEIASELRITEADVRQNLSKARAKLRRSRANGDV
jgi:RNA polymerase sigma factor (sigma-70 family)